MLLDVSTFLPCAPAEAEKHIRSVRLLEHVAGPLIRFVHEQKQPPGALWDEGTYRVRMYLFGLIPLGWQAVVISFPEHAGGFCVRDNGYGPWISRWDHVITIEPSGDGTLYRDRLTIEAGILTPGVWLFAQLFYRHRQRRWRGLVRRQFRYGAD